MDRVSFRRVVRKVSHAETLGTKAAGDLPRAQYGAREHQGREKLSRIRSLSLLLSLLTLFFSQLSAADDGERKPGVSLGQSENGRLINGD
jgi:hypothetical protein